MDIKLKSNKKGLKIIICCGLMLILGGILVALYPFFSDQLEAQAKADTSNVVTQREDIREEAVANYLNAQSQTVAIDQYEEAARANTAYYEGLLEQAQAFNEGVLKRGTLAVMTEAEKAEYNSLLNLNGDGVMGYIEIPKLDLRLSIAHGTDEDVLQKMVGHVEGTSLPVGGESTPAVLSAHRGLPTAKLFSDLDLMQVGDRFTIYTLNQALTYQVDQITVILPEEIEALAIEPGKDYVTLMTCTPYAVNTHRLLVRGVRVPDDVPTPEPESEPEKEPLDARRMLQNVVLPATAGILFVIMTVLLLKVVRGGRRKK